MQIFEPALLLQQKRNELTELEFYGFIVYCSGNKITKTIGTTNAYPFFHRSCAKPLQASLINDFDTINHYDLNEKEIAIACGSHTGEKTHIETLKNMLKKGGFCENNLKCPPIAPLNNFDGLKDFTPLHNNCSGKHTLMLLMSKQMGWDTKNYLDFNHPLQIKIHEKIKHLCEENSQLSSTLDGCNAPNWATSLESLGKGFLNLSSNNPQIINAIKKEPYLFGGKNRLDTHLTQLSPQIVAKVGAGGLCVIVNTETNESLVIKVIDADMKARTIIALDALMKLNWVNKISIDTNLLNDFFDKNIYTQTGVKTGEYVSCFDINQSQG